MDHRPVGIQGVVYKDSSYRWHRITKEGEELDRYLFPGEMWGVLRGLDVGLNLEHILLQLPDGQRKVFFPALACKTCNKGLIKVFKMMQITWRAAVLLWASIG